MPYIIIEDFRGGLDKRRMDVHAPPGSLIELTNAHITRGGEIEKRPAFIEVCDFPAGTIGLVSGGGSILRLERLLRIRLRFPPLRQTTSCISSLFTRPGKTWLRF